MKIIEKIRASQQPIDIFRERKERMRLLAWAPLLCLVVLLALVSLYPSSWAKNGANAKLIGSSLAFALVWLIAVANARKISAVNSLYSSPSVITRFLLDLPFLLFCLTWSLWSFYVVNAFEYAFLLNIYALIVYAALRSVKAIIYAFATLVIGFGLPIALSIFWSSFVSLPRPAAFGIQSISETFASLYLGLYFFYLQDYLVRSIKVLFRWGAKLFDGVTNDDEEPQDEGAGKSAV